MWSGSVCGRHFLHITKHIVPEVSRTLVVSISLHHRVQKNTLILQWKLLLGLGKRQSHQKQKWTTQKGVLESEEQRLNEYKMLVFKSFSTVVMFTHNSNLFFKKKEKPITKDYMITPNCLRIIPSFNSPRFLMPSSLTEVTTILYHCKYLSPRRKRYELD